MEVIKNEDELYEIAGGGINFNSSIINAIVAGAKIILELGRSVGSALRRTISNDMC